MKGYSEYKVIFIAVIAIFTLWGIFSLLYLGEEDGSSGLSPLGWISMIYFIPGVITFSMIKGAYSNSDIIFAAIISWVIYVGMSVVVVFLIWKFNNGEPPQIIRRRR